MGEKRKDESRKMRKAKDRKIKGKGKGCVGRGRDENMGKKEDR